MTKKRLGQVLVERKRISHEDMEKVVREHQSVRQQSGYLGEILLERGLIARDDLVAALEEVTHFRFVDPHFATVEKAVLELIPYQAAVRYCVLPLIREGGRIITVMAEPQNLHTLTDLKFMTGMEISPRLGFRTDINRAIEKCYAQSNESEQVRVPFIEQIDVSSMQFFTTSSNERSKAAIEEFEADLRNERTPAVRLVSAIICAASEKRASDIHIEPQGEAATVRVRVDGVLRELTNIPKEFQSAVISRIKILCDMDIAERRSPQDGRFLVQINNRNLDLRVSTLPTHYGEKVVMRLLDPAATRVKFSALGFSEENSKVLEATLKSPQGMLLVTGPTGSGKTTTLYSALNSVRSQTVNIITVEDPIEYKMEDINQVQINPKAGLTFANCLRSILRQDPNIIMVGEIRDAETAEIALQSAQTGHLVLSTLHTNDSISAITRLIDLKVPAFLVASSVTAVIAQRLVRRLCECHDEADMTDAQASRFLAAGIVDFGNKIHAPAGCAKCDNSGFKGRVGIYEVLVLDEQIRSAIRSEMRDEDIRNMARSGGMRLMQEDALDKVKNGVTTLDEILRVVPFDNVQALRCRTCGKSLAPSFLFCPYCGTGTRRVQSSTHAA